MIDQLVAVAAILASYDCQIEAPRAIGFEGDKATASEIGLPPATLQFAIRIEDGNPKQAILDWPNDPMRLAGKFPALSTAPDSYAFSAFSLGPCLFTEQGCLTQFNLVANKDGSARLIIAPVALSTDEKGGTRSPFAVLARGQCQRTGKTK